MVGLGRNLVVVEMGDGVRRGGSRVAEDGIGGVSVVAEAGGGHSYRPSAPLGREGVIT